jgi:hypothetical protein
LNGSVSIKEGHVVLSSVPPVLIIVGDHSLCVPQELSAISKFSAGPMTLSLWWLIFMDFGVIPERLAWIGLFGFMTGIYSILWNR